MKNLRNILPIALLLLLTFCTNHESKKTRDREYTSAELLGKWTQVNTDKSGNDPQIEFIRLINDSVAEIQLLDTTGVRTVSGKWENGFKKEIKSLNITIESDIKISFSQADSIYNTLVLRLGEENKKTILSGYTYKFIKE